MSDYRLPTTDRRLPTTANGERQTANGKLRAVGRKSEVGDRRSEPQWAQLAVIPFFLLLMTVVPVVQIISELRRGEPVQELDIFQQGPTLEGIQSYERALEDNSVVAEAIRRRVQWLSLVALRGGNEKAIVGKGDTIFYRPGLDSVIEPGFMSGPHQEGHPVDAIVAFRDSLRSAGVELALLPVPGKQTIYPEWLSRRYPTRAGPPANQDMAEFLAEMKRQDVRVVDPTGALWRAKGKADLYLRHDTHWTPEGLDVVADELARRLPPVQGEPRNLRAEAVPIARYGDLFDMLELPQLPTLFSPQRTTIRRVVDADTGKPLEPDPEAPIVLLGDSFSNIYSWAEMGWGTHAGLGEQLALRLGQSIDMIIKNDGGVNTARASLARRPDGLSGKKLVIWQFAARDLVVSNGDWQRIKITRG